MGYKIIIMGLDRVFIVADDGHIDDLGISLPKLRVACVALIALVLGVAGVHAGVGRLRSRGQDCRLNTILGKFDLKHQFTFISTKFFTVYFQDFQIFPLLKLLNPSEM